jgi:hypothetical protein
VKRWQGRESDTHPHLIPMLITSGTIPPRLHIIFMEWCLIKHRGTFKFILQFRFPQRRYSEQCASARVPRMSSSSSSVSSAEVTNTWSCISNPLYFFIACSVITRRENFASTFTVSCHKCYTDRDVWDTLLYRPISSSN